MADALTPIITALQTGFGDMASQVIASIAAIAPKVLPVTAAVLVIGIIIRVVKKFTGR